MNGEGDSAFVAVVLSVPGGEAALATTALDESGSILLLKKSANNKNGYCFGNKFLLKHLNREAWLVWCPFENRAP